MRKIIISDIDGTLVPEGGRDLNPEYFEVITKLVEKGNVFVAASGRPSPALKAVMAPIVDKIWLASQNGNVIEYLGKAETVNVTPFDWLKELYTEISKYEGSDIVPHTASYSFGLHPDSYMFHLLKENYGLDIRPIESIDQLAEETISTFAIYYPDAAYLLKEAKLKEKWAGKLDLVQSGDSWIDCLYPGTNKGYALKAISEKTGIPMENTIAFGDNLNDVPLLKAGAKSYAVENAQPATKEAADEIIPGFKDDGVLQVLKKLLEE